MIVEHEEAVLLQLDQGELDTVAAFEIHVEKEARGYHRVPEYYYTARLTEIQIGKEKMGHNMAHMFCGQKEIERLEREVEDHYEYHY